MYKRQTIHINDFCERLVVLRDETVNIYMYMTQENVSVEVKLFYSDIESLGNYEQIDNIYLQGNNRGFAFSKGAIVERKID